jgi:membrane-bound inhibitor of C-type lysozyme/uncharacterized membrane protein
MRYHYLLIFVLLLSACSTGQTQGKHSTDSEDFHPDQRPLATTLVYDCNGYDFIARVGPGEMALWLPDEYVVLSQVRSASGSLYEEGDLSFWTKGDDAMLTVGEQIYQPCSLQPQRVPWEDARRRGVDFRATGNEPGWHLEIQSGRQLLFVFAYGVERVLVLDLVEETMGSTRMYTGASGNEKVKVEIEKDACVDTMSGERFPEQVVVTLGDRFYSGCGKSLDYPWVVPQHQ